MISESVRQKIKKIKIHTRRLMQNSIAGDYLSAFKGSGLEFDQLREYQFGDDVRAIDWNSSAKMNKIMIKQFVEERDRTIILAIDVSASASYSSVLELRKESIAQIAAALAFVANDNKDKVGAVFFSDKIEKWIAPSRGSGHVGQILESIFSLQPDGIKTDIAGLLRFLINLKKRNAIVFILSDWIDDVENYKKLLKVCSVEYDLIGFKFCDKCEHVMPRVGLLDVYDQETGQLVTVDLSRKGQKELNKFLFEFHDQQARLFEKYRVDMLELTIGQPFVNQLVNFLHRRIRRQI